MLCKFAAAGAFLCGALLTIAYGELRRATLPSRPMARVWHQIGVAADGDLGILAERLTWMPAHTSQATATTRVKSDGQHVTLLVQLRPPVSRLRGLRCGTKRRF